MCGICLYEPGLLSYATLFKDRKQAMNGLALIQNSLANSLLNPPHILKETALCFPVDESPHLIKASV